MESPFLAVVKITLLLSMFNPTLFGVLFRPLGLIQTDCTVCDSKQGMAHSIHHAPTMLVT